MFSLAILNLPLTIMTVGKQNCEMLTMNCKKTNKNNVRNKVIITFFIFYPVVEMAFHSNN